MKRHLLCTVTSMLSAMAMSQPAAPDLIATIDVDQPTVELKPHLYGLFFEDINYAADGGLYAELIQNRSFEYYKTRGNDRLGQSMHPLFAWEKVERNNGLCELSVTNSIPLNSKNTNYITVTISNTGKTGVMNTGFDGIKLDKDAKYDVSVYARAPGWEGRSDLTVSLEQDGVVCGQTVLSGIGKTWQKFEGVITATQDAPAAHLLITTEGKGTLCLDMISLFPQDTFMGRKNGMRKDLAQALKELDPKFLRFPGGCIAHGDGLDNIYRWKDTVGDVAERKPNWNRWGYHQTYGLGYFEYFQLCEDLGAAPLPVVPVGVSCGFTPPQEAVPMDELGPWIQDALDLIEFANGDIHTEWGALRAEMGHPEPFNLEFVALGNEPHDNDLFRNRFPPFVDAIRDAYPDIKIVGTSGLGTRIPIYDLMTEQKVYSSDEHYYMPPNWFLHNTHRFDNFDRSKPLIFVGEYAAHDTLYKNGMRVNTMYSAVSEAAYLTGIERNGDMVDMTCYAPLFGHRLHSQWSPDLIYFDNHDMILTANYYVQQLFACNKGDVYLQNTLVESAEAEQPTLSGAIGVGTWRTAIEVKNVQVNGKDVDLTTWTPDRGNFSVNYSILKQNDIQAEAAISLGDTVYEGETVTLTLQAKKTGGAEGFLIQFGTLDGQSDFWWNIGGWGNSRHALQRGNGRNRSEVTPNRPGSIAAGTWYDIKVALTPGNIKCYLNDELIHDYNIEKPTVSMAAALDKNAGKVIVKLVNPREENAVVAVNLNGAGTIAAEGTCMTIAGDKNAHNTFEAPDTVQTETTTIQTGPSFETTLPPCSVQFIRVKAE